MQDDVRKKSNKQTITVVVAILIAAVVIFFGGAFAFSQIFSGHVKTADEYCTYTLESNTYKSTLAASGIVSSVNSTQVIPEVEGTVASIEVANGDKVEAGAVVMTIENSEITANALTAANTLAQATNMLNSAQTNFDSAQAALTNAQQQRAALDTQASSESATSTDASSSAPSTLSSTSSPSSSSTAASSETIAAYDYAVSLAQSMVTSAQSTLDVAKANAEEAQKANDEAQAKVDALSVKAPVAGTVLGISAAVGDSTKDVLAEGAAMEIADVSDLAAVVQVPADQIDQLAIGQSATLTVSSLPDTTITASVCAISDVANPEVQIDGQECYDVTLTLSTSDVAVLDAEVDAEIVTRSYGRVFYVPSAAVLENGGAYYVEIVYSDNTTRMSQVSLIAETDDDQLVISSNSLSSGTAIRQDLAE